MRVEFLTNTAMCGVSWGATKTVGVKADRHMVRLGHGWHPHPGWSIRAGLSSARPLDFIPEVVEGLMANFGRTLALFPLLDALLENFPDEFDHVPRFQAAWQGGDKDGWLVLNYHPDSSSLMVGADRLRLTGPSLRGAVRVGFRLVSRKNVPTWEPIAGCDLPFRDPPPELLAALAAVRSTADWQAPLRLAAAHYPPIAGLLTDFERLFLASVGGAG